MHDDQKLSSLKHNTGLSLRAGKAALQKLVAVFGSTFAEFRLNKYSFLQILQNKNKK
jgi:hypothetical protein